MERDESTKVPYYVARSPCAEVQVTAPVQSLLAAAAAEVDNPAVKSSPLCFNLQQRPCPCPYRVSYVFENVYRPSLPSAAPGQSSTPRTASTGTARQRARDSS
jgi:hypothetical protein